MRYQVYTEAVYQNLRHGMSPDSVLQNLKEVLARRGHEMLYASVVEGLLRKLQKDVDTRTLRVTLAREKDQSAYTEHIAQLQKELGVDVVTTVVDESIIGGFVAETTTHKRDQSYKASLLSLYRALNT